MNRAEAVQKRKHSSTHKYSPKAIRASLELLKITQVHARKRIRDIHKLRRKQTEGGDTAIDHLQEETMLILPMNLRNDLRRGMNFDDNSKGTREQKNKRIRVMREGGYKRILHVLSTDLLTESRELHTMDEYRVMARYIERLSFSLSENRDHYCLLTSGTSRLRERLQYMILSYGIEVRSRMMMYKVAPAA